MRIKRVFSKNFRTLADFDYEFSHAYCPISGPNNAGKSCVIRIIQHFLQDNDRRYFFRSDEQISFDRDKTQWIECTEVVVGIVLEIYRVEDSETFFFLDRFASQPAHGDCVQLTVSQTFEAGKQSVSKCSIDNVDLDSKTSIEIIKKLRSSTNFVLHNSTNGGRARMYFDDSFIELGEEQIDEKDKKSIRDAEAALRKKIDSAARKQTEMLSGLIGRLNEDYEITLSTVDTLRPTFPLTVKLKDRQVSVPLPDWGSGTKNRTEILMSMLEAARTKAAAQDESRTTPVVILEEPESFLHPLAQAEFGKLISALSEELGIQVIATTHSPYMLNHRTPDANVLLQRTSDKRRLLDTVVVKTTGDNWMQPFSEILGIIPPEFDAWRSVMGVNNDKLVLVEGVVDKKYFEFFQAEYPDLYSIPNDVAIEEYGGKDSLQNVALLRFVMRKFKKLVVTFDLDAENAVRRPLESIGLTYKSDFISIGKQGDGTDCIEGLLPNSVSAAVYGREVALVQASQSADKAKRKSAKNNLKAKLLEELKQQKPDPKELQSFKNLFNSVAACLKK